MVFVWNSCNISRRDVASLPTNWEMSLYFLVMLFTFGWIIEEGNVIYMTLAGDLGVRPPFIMIFPSQYYVNMFSIISLSLEIGRVSSTMPCIFMLFMITLSCILPCCLLYICGPLLLPPRPSTESASGSWSEGNLRDKLIGVLKPIDLLFSGCSRVTVEAPSDGYVDSCLLCG